jgi:hypothetical protein
MSVYAQPKNKPARNQEYIRFVRSRPCALCGKTWHIEAAHFGPHGFWQKASDWQVIPLCGGPSGKCHRLQGKMKVHEFEEKYHVNVYRTAFELLTSWLDMKYQEMED